MYVYIHTYVRMYTLKGKCEKERGKKERISTDGVLIVTPCLYSGQGGEKRDGETKSGSREREKRNARKRADRETIVNDGRLKCPLGPRSG